MIISTPIFKVPYAIELHHLTILLGFLTLVASLTVNIILWLSPCCFQSHLIYIHIKLS